MSKILIPILLILGLLVGVYLVSQQTSLFSRADISTTPQEIKVTNISDNSFTVTWLTDKATTGFVSLQGVASGSATADDRDTGIQQSRTTHHVSVKDLEPSKVYYYKINSGAESFDDKGKLFQQTTAPTTENPPAPPEPIFGKVTKQDGSIPNEALVYLEMDGGSPLSGYIRDDGNWLITLNNARTKDLSNYKLVKDSDPVNLLIQAGVDGNIEIKAEVGEKDVFAKIVLPAQESSGGGIRDLNRDGVINAFDYVLSFLLR